MQTDQTLRRFREYVAAGLGAIIVIGMVIMLVIAFGATDDAEEFNRIKDLLLVVNPLVGVVVGYYFNKVSTEARAENAEATAKNAVSTAEAANKAREQAQQETTQMRTDRDEAQKATEDVRSALVDVTTTAELMLEETEAPMTRGLEDMPMTRGLEQPETTNSDALRASLDRAKQYLK